jgi:DnaJ-class molecular chaperone
VKNYYEILQVFPNATVQEIKDAFRLLLFRYHPDHNKGKEEWAVERTMELVEAYHVLSDAAKRAHYDVVRALRPRDGVRKKGFALFGKAKELAAQTEAAFKEGLEQYRRGEYEQAVATFRKVLDADGEYPGVRVNLALCFLAIGRLHDATAWLQDHLARQKDDADARAALAKINALAVKMRAGGAKPD